MTMIWIKPLRDLENTSPVYEKKFSAGDVSLAKITVTALGCYEIILNGKRVSEYIFAPGWTEKRLQFQEYDITKLLQKKNSLQITVGRGWHRSPLAGWREEDGRDPRLDLPPAIAARIEIVSEKNVSEKKPPTIIETDTSWRVYESAVRFSEIYDGEIYDARLENPTKPEAVEEFSAEINLVPQQGDEIREMEKIPPIALITTPKNETVIDFGQNITGYVQFFLPKTTESGQEVKISFAETLDPDGNFYTENYRTAKSYLHYICRDGAQSYKPKFTFFGFRYIRLDAFPTTADVKNFTAIAVYSNIKQTGWLSSSNPNLNRFFENVIWSQKGNFLDVPTDCPQRDERLGWTGDAQVFVKTAALNFDVERFFTKWLADLSNAQLPSGLVPHVVPDTQKGRGGSAAWGDAATICPWEIYLAYGNEKILLNQFESMCKWVDFIEESASKTDFIWKNGIHFGDWLSLELPPPDAPDIRRGATRHDFLATAFFAHSVDLVIKAGKVIGRDVSSYKILRKKIIEAFRKTFPENDYRTQTEFILPLQFNLAENPQKVADALAKKIAKDGDCLKTGFVGTPYILHVLSRYGHTSLAYTLLLREEYPSWLYPVTKGATTIWERWDSIKPDGSFQTSNMNSFNHYAYGAAADWVYTVAAGIKTSKNHPGYARIKISPQPDPRLEWLSARLETRHGTIFSKWSYVNDKIRYEIRTPSPAEIKIGDKIYKVKKGTFVFMEGNKLNENPSETHEYHEDYEVRTIRCPSCKEFYSFIEGFPPCACPECMEIREEQRKHLREIIRENKGINAMELQKLTEIPISFILQVLEDGDITLETNTIST